MSILINLLPDIRQAKIRERRRRQLASGIAVVIWIVCGGVVALLAVYEIGQKAIISSLTNNIASNEQHLEAIPNLTNALTAQQALASLPSLYSQRIYMTKFLQAYTTADPTTTTLTSLTVDAQNNLTLVGVATDYSAVAKLARAISASNVSIGLNSAASNTPYFNNVTISSASADGQTGIDFTINAVIDPGALSGN
jgi:Tfp pilus assembly protein PilN